MGEEQHQRHWTARLGWLGIPLGLLCALSAFAFAGNENAAFAVGAVIAAIGGAVLPRPDGLIAIAIGVLLYGLMWRIPQGGADSPLNVIAAFCSAGFGLGAFLATLFRMVRDRLTEPQR